ncbi:MAG: hypothetical protein IK004_03700 [Bacteroidales bacterium]|nr:hypothetical protein [Bacteroidales bacterium]
MLKSIRKYGILVLVAMVVLSSCMDKNARKNNYPVPGVDFTLPVGQVYTIDTLLTMWKLEGTHKFTQDASVYGVVIADETSGNLYKASFIQDGNNAIELYMKSTSGLRIGDSVRVYLKGATLSEYSGTPQIQDLNPNNITILANNINIEPEEISTLDVNSSYICHLVKFNHVEFAAADRNKTYAPTDAYGQFILNQYDENCNLVDGSIIVRTSNYASFAKTQLPQGNGSIVGILTYYSTGSAWQFTIRSLSEVNMNNDPCEENVIVINPEGSGTQDDPYNIAAAIINQGVEAQWIKGYIVGSANIASGNIENDSQISWNAPFNDAANAANLILADNPNERDINNCVVVYLPSNAASGIREINLKDHPGNLGKTLKVKGNLKTYLGKPGMKDSNEYSLN